MKNLTTLYSSFKRTLEMSPHIKIIDIRSQFDPPSESYKRAGASDLRAEGFEVEDWLHAIIGLTRGNSITYHVIRDRQNRGEGSFNLNAPQEFLLEAEPWVVKNGSNEADKAMLKHVRVIDQPNVAQTFTGIVMQPGCPPEIPQELVYFRRGKLLMMSLKFKDYYEMVSHFMGIVDWQLLFTDANPKEAEMAPYFHQLLDSYQAFQVIFPARDFSIWSEKLREKQLIA